MTDQSEEPVNPMTSDAGDAAKIIERFGGIRPMATKLKVPVTTVQGWKKRGLIPAVRLSDIRTAAAQHDIKLDEAELAAATAEPETTTEPPAQKARIETVRVYASVPETVVEPRPAPETTMQAPAASNTKGARGAAWAAAVVALIACLGAITAPLWSPQIFGTAPPPQPQTITSLPAGLEERLSALESRAAEPLPVPEQAPETESLNASVQNLAQRLSALQNLVEEGFNTAPADDPRVDTLTTRLNAMESQVAAVGGQAQDTGGALDTMNQSLQAMQAQVAQLNSQLEEVRRTAGQSQAFALAVGQLHAALESGRPYLRELEAVQNLSNDQSGIADAVFARAEQGIPTLRELSTRFESVASDIVKASHRNDDQSLGGQMLERVQSIVTIRRVGPDVQGQEPDAIVARTEAALNQGNLAAAVDALSMLEGRPAEVATSWLEDAHARLMAQDTINTLYAAAIDRVGRAVDSQGDVQP